MNKERIIDVLSLEFSDVSYIEPDQEDSYRAELSTIERFERELQVEGLYQPLHV
jgi:hypothetical protein